MQGHNDGLLNVLCTLGTRYSTPPLDLHAVWLLGITKTYQMTVQQQHEASHHMYAISH
jgi:hypothetical protein